MSKNGRYFVAIVPEGRLLPSVWDPYLYRPSEKTDTLANYVSIRRPTWTVPVGRASPYRPIEYRDIPRGPYQTFVLEPSRGLRFEGTSIVGEGQLLFGTMRAYLGNAVVTPRAAWLGQAGPLSFYVKSEFVVIAPHDELPYFWLAYVRSDAFLGHLPLGGGGTRPRLHAETLAQTPVWIPPLDVRQRIHHQLQELARQEWEVNTQTFAAVATLATGR